MEAWLAYGDCWISDSLRAQHGKAFQKTMNPNEPAFPSPAFDGVACRGMSLRAYFTAIPLCEEEFTRLSDSFFAKFPKERNVSLAQLRVINADALIAELSKDSKL